MLQFSFSVDKLLLFIFTGYQVWLNFGLNEYLTSDERSADIIGQNKEGVYSIFGKKYLCAMISLSFLSIRCRGT